MSLSGPLSDILLSFSPIRDSSLVFVFCDLDTFQSQFCKIFFKKWLCLLSSHDLVQVIYLGQEYHKGDVPFKR